MRSAALFLVAVALLGGVAWWRWRGDDAPGPVPAGMPAPVAVPVPRPVPAVRPALDPAIAAPLDPVAPPAPDSVPFEREVRDPGWAVDQERELRLRLDRLGVTATITSAECRHRLCRLDVDAATAAELSALYGALETPEGLYGWADAIVLGEVATDRATGRLTTHVLVQFDR